MVEMLTGQRLSPGAPQTDRLPVPFGAVARRALADDPRHRFASADEMLEALHAPAEPTAAGDTSGHGDHRRHRRAGRPPAPHSSPRLHRRRSGGRGPGLRRRRLALVAFALVALAAAAFLLFEQDAQPTGPASTVVHHRTDQPADPGPHPPEHHIHHRRPELRDRRIGRIAGRRRVPGRRRPRQRPAGDGRATTRCRPGVVGAAGSFPRRGAPRRRRHHVGPISGRRHRPAADRCDGHDIDDGTSAGAAAAASPFSRGHGHGHGGGQG